MCLDFGHYSLDKGLWSWRRAIVATTGHVYVRWWSTASPEDSSIIVINFYYFSEWLEKPASLDTDLTGVC